MGALILTKGTRRLINHLSREFKNPRIDDYRSRADLFATSNVNGVASSHYLHYLCFGDDIQPGAPATGVPSANTPQFPHNRKLIPDPHGAHPHLLKRWQYYLFYELQMDNHNKIRAAIHTALTDVDAQGNPTFSKIVFDCVEGPFQTVFPAPEYESSDSDDTSDDPRTKYMKIVLITGPSQAPDQVDLQFAPKAKAD